MRNSCKLDKIFSICGTLLVLAGSPAFAGDHHGYGQPVYLVPVGPVAAYAPAPIAYAPAPAVYAPAPAYAPPARGHHLFHKNKYYAYPVAAYAQPAPYGYAAAPAAAYTVTTYTVQPTNSGAAPAGSGYSWKLVKNDGGDQSAAAPGSNSNLPTFSDLTPEKNDKILGLAKSNLSDYTSMNMSISGKKNALASDIKGFYATESGTAPADISSTAGAKAAQLANALVDGNSGSSNSDDNNDKNNDKSNSVKVYLAPAPPLQLFLPVVPVRPGHFYKGY